MACLIIHKNILYIFIFDVLHLIRSYFVFYGAFVFDESLHNCFIKLTEFY